jgi:hypothetical protein
MKNEAKVDQKLLSTVGVVSGGSHSQAARPVVAAAASSEIITVQRTVLCPPIG